jgi:hypothetical protein
MKKPPSRSGRARKRRLLQSFQHSNRLPLLDQVSASVLRHVLRHSGSIGFRLGVQCGLNQESGGIAALSHNWNLRIVTTAQPESPSAEAAGPMSEVCLFAKPTADANNRTGSKSLCWLLRRPARVVKISVESYFSRFHNFVC